MTIRQLIYQEMRHQNCDQIINKNMGCSCECDEIPMPDCFDIDFCEVPEQQGENDGTD
jgi:hypothetical protein